MLTLIGKTLLLRVFAQLKKITLAVGKLDELLRWDDRSLPNLELKNADN